MIPKPYESEEKTYDEPMAQELREIRDAGLVLPGDPDRLVRNTRLRYLTEAATTAGVEITDFELSKLRWLSEWEDSTVLVVIGLLLRAAHEPATVDVAGE